MLIVDYLLPKPAKAIKDFDALLVREEGEGILQWAVEGAIQLMRELDETGGIHLTDKQRRRVDDLLSESDSVRSFVQECIESEHGRQVTVYALTEAYRDYCDAREWEPLRDKQFQAELPDAMLEFHRAIRGNDIKHEGKSVRGFRGVKLRNSLELGDDLGDLEQELQFPDGSDGSQKLIIAKNKNTTIKNAIPIKVEHPSEASETEEGEL
jgi:phage/plasmid-associated DNA primase